MDLIQSQYAIWASGSVDNIGLPAFSPTYYGDSLGTIDIRFHPGLVSLQRVKIFRHMGFQVLYFLVFS